MATFDQNDHINASYKIWKQFSSKLAIVLSYDYTSISSGEKKKYESILHDIFETYPSLCEHLVPASTNDETILEQYTSFDNWLFGQFVNIYLRDHYESLNNKCAEAQIALLKYISETNLFIYESLIRSYIEMLRDLCDIIAQNVDYNTTFEWFRLTATLPVALSKPPFRIQNTQLTGAVALTLKILNTYMPQIHNTCALNSLWRSAIALLKHFDSDRATCYYFTTNLIKQHDLPDHDKKFNSIVSELLLHIMNDIGKLCQIGKIRGEDEFCALLSTLSDQLFSETCYDFSYINSLYCLIFQCQVSLAESTEELLLAFFAKLLQLSANKSDVFTIFCENIQPLNLSLLAIALENSINKQIERMKHNANIYLTNKNWKSLIEQTTRYVKDIEKKLNISTPRQIIALFKSIENITQTTVNIYYRFNKDINFFGDEIYNIVDRLVKMMETSMTKKLLLLFFTIIKNILQLPEIRDDGKKTFLLAVLSLPLPSFQLASCLSATFHDRYHNLIDDEVRVACITSLMHVRELDSTHKYKLFKEILANPCSEVFKYLPLLIYHLKDDELQTFQDYLFDSSALALTQFSLYIRKSICALDGFCTMTKLPNRHVELYCTTCDSKFVQSDIKREISADRRRIINQLIFSVTPVSDDARFNVLSVAVQLSNHLCDTNLENFLSLLHSSFDNQHTHIRRQIVRITPRILFKTKSENKPNQLFNTFVKSLQKELVGAVINEDSDMQYHCIRTIGEIGSIPIEMTLFPCVHLLINPLILAPSNSSLLAKNTIEQIARAHDQVEEHIYLKYRDNIFPLVTHLIVMNYSIFKTTLYDLHFDYTSVFNALTQPHILKYLLPHAVQYPEVRHIVAELAEICDLSVAQMLRNGFRHIFLHVVLSEEPNNVVKLLELLERETGDKISDMLGGCVAKILADLLIHYEEKPERVQWCIVAIRKLLSKSTLSNILSLSQPSQTLIVPFIQHRFFGIMMSLENQLCSDLIPAGNRRQIISSLKSIIELMGSSYITSIRFKVLLTLRTIIASEKAKSPRQCVQLWNTFVRTIDPNVLGPILSTIFVSLIPFADNYSVEINSIFRYLVVENQSSVYDYLHELYFVEARQCDNESYTVINSTRKFADMSLENKLEWLAELSQHEIVEIKLHALKRLRNEVSENHKQISQLILATYSINSLIPKILNVLVEGFCNRDEQVQEASGLCLGEFGAIDPSYIPNTVIKINDAKKYTCYGIDDIEFIINTLTVLCRGFQMAKNNTIMDTFALAIQTTLKSYNVTDNERCRIWSKLAKNLREIIQPFHTTMYVLLTHDNESTDTIPYLIYNTRTCTSVQKWAHSWSHFLISLLPANSKERNIFHCFKGVISYDNESMLLFLPHILLNAVLSAGEDNLAKIYEEMMSVIRNDRGNDVVIERSSTQLVVTEELSVIRNQNQSMDAICIKTVFRLLDVLYKKYRDMRTALNGKQSNEFKKLANFLTKFSTHQLAEKSFERKEYARSLLYMEEYLSKNEKVADILDKNLAFLAKTYVYLNDVDNVKGLFASHSVKLRQPQHVIMLHEITDQFQDAAICYQQLLKDSDEERSLLYEKHMIKGYLAMNQPEMALRFVNSLSTSKIKNSKYFDDVKCEALWNLSQYEDLAKLTATKSAQLDDNWGVRIGTAIVHFLNRNPTSLADEIDRIRKTLTKSLHLSSAAFGGYHECYESVIKLHVLNEFEKIADLVFTTNVNVDQWQSRFETVIKVEFQERLNKLQPVSRVLQPVLNIRQALFSVARHLSSERPELVVLFNEEIRKCWLKIIEIANRTRNFQLAYSNILAIDNYQLKGFFIEKAKYYWEKMEQREALRTLQHGLQYHYNNFEQLVQNKSIENLEDRKICAEAKLLIGTYNDAMINTDLITNLQYFKDAVKLYPNSEKTLLKFAQYMDRICASDPPEDRYRTRADFYLKIVQIYGQSLRYGCEFIYQSLSRMLNIWMDYATALLNDRGGRNDIAFDERRKALADMHKHVETCIKNLPVYYFCTAFSLIMSRLSHSLNECFDKLSLIIIKCILSYPNQTLWQFMSLYKIKNQGLAKRFEKIIKNPLLKDMIPLIHKFQQLFEQFSALSLSSRSGNYASGATLLTNLMRKTQLLESGQFDDILIPAQKFLTLILPRSVNELANTSSYNPYPEKMVFMSCVRNDIHVYSSLQKPIRANLVGTDGREYPMIFKAFDDMRIDCRCMQFNSVVNMYLKRDVEARDRDLRIRTYTVLPLLEKCGVIEFIPNLQSMRGINLKMRRSFGLTHVPVKQYECSLNDSLQKKRDVFRKLVSMCPPMLHEWYKQEFPNPTSWYAARTAYIRTLAVMSIVGYTLGLGDRHNDNILLDSTNGDVVHVDLNVVFNKGELLQWPERVPYRLTHSMIKAMGPLGYEGTFLRTSEIVNRILRDRKEQLISILNTFLYDPLEPQADKNNELLPSESLRKVELRLNGCVTAYQKPPSIPLSVEGQTRKLIDEATSEDNLCQMYIGWSAFI